MSAISQALRRAAKLFTEEPAKVRHESRGAQEMGGFGGFWSESECNHHGLNMDGVHKSTNKSEENLRFLWLLILKADPTLLVLHVLGLSLVGKPTSGAQCGSILPRGRGGTFSII